ncbi:hypothetical protein [Methylobacterium sp. E-045]|uniref:hypothetical protein n=1 Tax=Methylobacterium sp. E-045 TaxID=2836575 RepID=UPI001FB89D86|nr:hypothetical protein [Methylobacterium sp. E-045]MCJ2128203.1 hypothetical protein [Methylobacterium sp. E-045]
MTRAKFIVAMAREIAAAGRLTARRSLQLAAEAYRAFVEGNGIEFGDEAYAWDEDAARLIAREYEINHWEAAA